MYKRKRAGNTITRKINSTKDTAAKADKNHYISNSYLEGFIPIDTEYFTASAGLAVSVPLEQRYSRTRISTTAIRVTTTCRGSGAVPAGRISADTLSTRFPKGSSMSMTTASRQCRESSTATGYSPLRIPLTKSILVIMKNASSCVSRRKDLFWRLSGRGLTSKSLYRTPGWIKQLIMSLTGVIRPRPIWKTGAAALSIISARMRSVHSQ